MTLPDAIGAILDGLGAGVVLILCWVAARAVVHTVRRCHRTRSTHRWVRDVRRASRP